MYTLIIPVHNGASYLAETFQELSHFFASREPWEIIFVNDGSTDATGEKLRELKKNAQFPVRVIQYENNRGKGQAIRRGMLEMNPQSQAVAYTDVELPYGLLKIEEAFHILSTRPEIGMVAGRRDGTRQYSKYRKICTTIFRFFLPKLVRRVPDTQCGCKIFNRSAAEYIFSRVRTSRWVFDIELFLAAFGGGIAVQELPVTIKPSCVTPRGGVSLFRHGLWILWDLWKIRWYEWRGKYGKLEIRN